jgi:hypothetical protein
MARYEHLPIYKQALDAATHFETVVAGFSRYHKYTLGTELRNKSREALALVVRANSVNVFVLAAGYRLSATECSGSMSDCGQSDGLWSSATRLSATGPTLTLYQLRCNKSSSGPALATSSSLWLEFRCCVDPLSSQPEADIRCGAAGSVS